jgi:hypothetical protein
MLFKDKRSMPMLKIIFLLPILSALLFYPVFAKKVFAGECACRGVYASNSVIYGLYLKARNKTVYKNDIITYIKIVDPAKYMRDRYNPFLWKELFLRDETKLIKLVNYINSIKCFKENAKAGLGSYVTEKHGFYLMYAGKNKIIRNGMKIDRNIDFVKIKNSHIYYLFHPLTIVYNNAGDFNFLKMPEKKAENFINKRTGAFGHIKKSIYLKYYFIPLTARHNVLYVKVLCVKVYSDKGKNLLLGTIK